MRGIGKVSKAALAAGGALAQQPRDGEQPPACGAVDFRPIEGSPADGEQQAG